MTIEELIVKLKEKIRAGVLDGEDLVVVRDPSVTERAMEAGTDGYHEVEEILVPRDGRVILLGETY